MMAVGREDLPNQGLSEDARQFVWTRNIAEPQDGEIVYFVGVAPFPFVVASIEYLIQAGECGIVLKRAGIAIDFDNTDTTGLITVDQPSFQSSEPDAETIVNQNEALTLEIEAPDTDAAGLVVQVNLRRTEVNIDLEAT